MTDYESVIGLEVHAQLLTRTKIFCGCSTKFGAAPNTQVCPTCLGLPGALPALNRAAVEMAVRAGKAFGCTIAQKSVWARKNYFYPDLPKGYQISQFELPICLGGKVAGVRLTRIHLEEDAGKLIHGEGASEVDLNRAGTPLCEIVSEPDLRSADEASDYLKTLRLDLIYLGVNDGNLEEGSFRCDANVSVRPRGEAKYGTRVELKNINSFRFVKAAIEFEIARQIELIESGGKVVQETRLFDSDKGETRPMRSKEAANDYRYFPDPDLPALTLTREFIDSVVLPKLPNQVMAELLQAGVSAADARILVENLELLRVYQEAPAGARTAHAVVNEVARAFKENAVHARFQASWLSEIFALQDAGTLSSTAAREVLAESLRSGESPKAIVEAKGLAQVSDNGALEAVVDAVLARSASEVARYKAGKTNLMGFFVGAAMKELKGKGNPALLNSLFKAKLGG
jgi:aspartyl-tRNA(Asn)/glutamyl-tRNA(Gln) amidotransferase subunit B